MRTKVNNKSVNEQVCKTNKDHSQYSIKNTENISYTKQNIFLNNTVVKTKVTKKPNNITVTQTAQ